MDTNVNNIIQRLLLSERNQRSSIFRSMVQNEPNALTILLEVLRLGNQDVENVGSEAAYWLGHLKNDLTFSSLMNILTNEPNAQVQANTIYALGLLGDSRPVELLITLLEDSNLQVRVQSANALGHIGDKRAIEPLIRLMKISSQEERLNIIDVLAMFKAPVTFEPLFEMLDENNEEAYNSIIEALGASHNPKAFSFLYSLLDDQDYDRLVAVLKGLRHLSDKRALEELSTLQKKALPASIKEEISDAIRIIQKS